MSGTSLNTILFDTPSSTPILTTIITPTTTPAMPIPAFYELSWSITSTIGLFACALSATIIPIVGVSLLSVIPVVVSASSALAGGLWYYAYFEHRPAGSRVAAGVVADLSWLLQSCGLILYVYLVLRKLLREGPQKKRVALDATYGLFMVGLITLKGLVLVYRAIMLSKVNFLPASESSNTPRGGQLSFLDRFQIGYFSLLALLECVLSCFLLSHFYRSCKKSEGNQASFAYKLASASEIRLSFLGLLGILRTLTFSFLMTAKNNHVALQADRFAATLICIFPYVLIVDLLQTHYSQRMPSDFTSKMWQEWREWSRRHSGNPSLVGVMEMTGAVRFADIDNKQQQLHYPTSPTHKRSNSISIPSRAFEGVDKSTMVDEEWGNRSAAQGGWSGNLMIDLSEAILRVKASQVRQTVRALSDIIEEDVPGLERIDETIEEEDEYELDNADVISCDTCTSRGSSLEIIVDDGRA